MFGGAAEERIGQRFFIGRPVVAGRFQPAEAEPHAGDLQLDQLLLAEIVERPDDPLTRLIERRRRAIDIQMKPGLRFDRLRKTLAKNSRRCPANFAKIWADEARGWN